MGHSPLYYLAFVYLVAVILIIVCDDWTKAAAVITIIAAMLTTTLCFVRLSKQCDVYSADSGSSQKNADTKTDSQPNLQRTLSSAEDLADPTTNTANTADITDQNPNTLGDDWEAHHVYNSTFDAVSGATVMRDSPAELAPDIDTRNTLMSGQRFQQKRSLDGMVSKTADYYKHNFAEELEESERKPWWGNSEF